MKKILKLFIIFGFMLPFILIGLIGSLAIAGIGVGKTFSATFWIWLTEKNE